MSKKIKILILGSVILNVLLIGVIIGHVSHRLGREDYIKKHTQDIELKLPADKEKLFFKTMEKVHLENLKIHDQIRENRESVLSILTSPDFDETSYQTEAQKLHRLRGLIMKQLADAVRELAEQFDQEERKALSEYLRLPPPPPPGIKPPYHSGPPPHHEDPTPHHLP
ncbi:MAG: periplasmic heavy metal sensor [Nitrospirota bacterium]